MRKLALVLIVVAALVAAASATAAVFVRLTTTTVQRGGVVRFVGYVGRLPIYVLPASRYPCAQTATCMGPLHRASPTKRPYVFIGRAPAAKAERPSGSACRKACGRAATRSSSGARGAAARCLSLGAMTTARRST